jgi:hypothetical protein
MDTVITSGLPASTPPGTSATYGTFIHNLLDPLC